MTIVDRSFTYRRRMSVSAEDFDLMLAGKKTCTIRLGTASFAADVLEIHDGQRSRTVTIEGVKHVRYRELTLAHATCEGFAGTDELRRDLQKYYNEIDDDKPMTVIFFSLLT